MTLRYDKRGIGGSQGPALGWLDLPGLTADATAAVTWLAARPEADPTRTGALGHSQGGDIALRAGRDGKADRVATLAAYRHLGVSPPAAAGALFVEPE